jgi:xanthine dehydrogenase YagR molybdenum-binding subunit
MPRLVKTTTVVEGREYTDWVVAPDEAPEPWSDDWPLSVVGRELPRGDGPDRVTGRAVYSSDVRLPNLLVTRVLRSPHAHARVKRIDTSRAERHPGVRAVLHAGNCDLPVRGRMNAFNRVLRHHGEAVCAVAAVDERAAEDALRLIEVDYEVLPHVTDPLAALAAGAPQVHDEGNLAGGKPLVWERGDWAAAYRDAPFKVERTFRHPAQLHNCFETHGTVALWEGERLRVWESTQSVHNVREQLAKVFELPLGDVEVTGKFLGGGFGSKGNISPASVIAAALARETGHPVKLFLDRIEENLATGHRHPNLQRIRMACDATGRFTAIELLVHSAIGAYARGAMPVTGPAWELYACENVRCEHLVAQVNTGATAAFRAPGYVEGAWALESAIDDLAHEAGLDPLEVRRRNHRETDARGQPYTANHLLECYRRGAEAIGWSQRTPAGTARGVVRRGLGMAAQLWGAGGGPPAHAICRVDADGSVMVESGTQDIGTGTKTVLAMVAAEALGVPLESVTMTIGSTTSGAYAPPSWGSMTVPSVAPAVRAAAEDARRQLLEVAAQVLDRPAGGIELAGGEFRAGAERLKTLADLMGELGGNVIIGRGSRGPNPAEKTIQTFGAQFAEVEVDVETGRVSVLRIVAVHDVGRIINPLTARSQVEGGIVQGLGFALTEGRVEDPGSGRVLTSDLVTYRLPTIMDAPRVETIFVDRADTEANETGAKGLGEPPIIPTAPAIANAIFNATGVRPIDLPMDRVRLLPLFEKLREALPEPAGGGR